MEEGFTDDPLFVRSVLLISIDQIILGDICFGDIDSVPAIGDCIHSNLNSEMFSTRISIESFKLKWLFPDMH